MNLNMSILVVTYKRLDLVERFHSTISESLIGHSNWELLYTDHSPDNSIVDFLSRHQQPPSGLSHHPENPGFAAGVNRLIRQSRFDWIVLLNPDVFGFSTSFWRNLVSNPHRQAATFGVLRDAFERESDCYGRFPSLFRPFMPRKHFKPDSGVYPIETGIMAFMFVASDIFHTVGDLDERFFMYAEDMDWCFRARKLGVSILLDTSIKLTHLGGQSAIEDSEKNEILRHKYIAEKLFINKHYRFANRLIMLFMNWIKIQALRS